MSLTPREEHSESHNRRARTGSRATPRSGRDRPPWGRITGSIAPLGASTAGILGLFDLASSAVVGQVGALVLLTAGVLYGGRLGVHLCSGYWERTTCKPGWTDRKRRRLNALLVLDGLLTATLLASGGWFLFSPSWWVEFGLGLVLALAIHEAGYWTIELAEAGALPRGSDTIENCFAVVGLRNRVLRIGSQPGVLWLYGLFFERKTPKDELSGLTVLIVITLAFAGLAQGMVKGATYLKGGSERVERRHTKPPNAKRNRPPPKSKDAPPPGGPKDTVAVAGESPPTYEDLCGKVLAPGDDAPPEPAAALQRVWYEFGGIVAGCAGPAWEVSKGSGVYAVIGKCYGKVRSVAVTSPQYPAAMLFAQSATLAERMATEHKLLGASAHIRAGPGQYQIVYTTDGAYILIRATVSDGRGRLTSAPRRCDELQPTAVKYVTLPPALADLWLRLGALKEPTWPTLDESRLGSGRIFYTFSTADAERRTIATGSCSSRLDCELRSGDLSWNATAAEAQPVTHDRMKQYGPR